MKLSPLDDLHKKLNARFINFGEWKLPIFFSGIINEHMSVRGKLDDVKNGVFDISHMGQIIVKNKNNQKKGSYDFLNHLLSNDLQKLEITNDSSENNKNHKYGKGQYTFMCNESGGVIDDLLIYKLHNEEYLMIINASKIDTVCKWMDKKIIDFDAQYELINKYSDKKNKDQRGGIAIQGQDIIEIFEELKENKLIHILDEIPQRNKIYEFLTQDKNGLTHRNFICRTGYTGEDGFEIFAHAEIIKKIYKHITKLEQTNNKNNKSSLPCGLGARDTLRLEVCYPLNGSDMNESRTPLEVGMKFFINFKKNENFIGKKNLKEQFNAKKHDILSAFILEQGSPPPRSKYKIFSTDKKEIGEISSGAMSPCLKLGIAMGYLPRNQSHEGNEILINIRSKFYRAKIIKKPFYKK